ncbi:MAG: hypothetical protein GKC04_09010, partial [Methanomicrobiales archaeon]|nr:hypothetical protein [Methanomicrobiales archaeon]
HVAGKIFDARRRGELEEELSRCRTAAGNSDGSVGIYGEPFLYSEKLARFGDGVRRDGLFVQKEPKDRFSECIEQLAGFVLRERGG